MIRNAGDRVTGLFAVDFIMLFFHLSCIGIVIAYWIRGRRILNAPPGLLLGAFVLALGVSNLKAGILYLVAMLGFLLLRGGAFAARGGRGRLVLASVALPVLVLGVFTPIYDRDYEKRENDSFAELIVNPAYVQRYMFGDEKVQFTPAGRLLRGRAIVFAWELTSRDSLHRWLGLGPGASSGSRLAGASGVLTRRYPGYEIDRTGLSMMIADTGLLGVAMHLAFLAAIFVWRPPGSEPEASEHRLVRELFVFLALAFLSTKTSTMSPSSRSWWRWRCIRSASHHCRGGSREAHRRRDPVARRGRCREAGRADGARAGPESRRAARGHARDALRARAPGRAARGGDPGVLPARDAGVEALASRRAARARARGDRPGAPAG